MASSIKNLITIDQLESYPDDDGNRYELIEGELFVSRAPGIPHQRVLHNLQVVFAEYLKRNPIGILVPGAGTVFSDYDAVIPDLVLVTNERWHKVVADDRFVAAPDLVIEILSPGKENRKRDLTAKRKLYSKHGVNEYWIVDSENRAMMVFRLVRGSLENIATLTNNERITSPLLPELNLRTSAIFDL